VWERDYFEQDVLREMEPNGNCVTTPLNSVSKDHILD
jgi:hypothetical protein